MTSSKSSNEPSRGMELEWNCTCVLYTYSIDDGMVDIVLITVFIYGD
jgi:hypothetical protein